GERQEPLLATGEVQDDQPVPPAERGPGIHEQLGPVGGDGPAVLVSLVTGPPPNGEWEPCLAARSTGGWCAGCAAQWYEKRPLKPLRRRRAGCDFPGCSNRHSSRGYCAAHYQQLRQDKTLTPLNQRRGWYKASNGYIYIWEREHPNADRRGYVAEHTKVMAAVLRRPLLPREEVHHRNGQRDDNRPKNLELRARGQQPPEARVSALVDEPVRTLRLYAPEKLAEFYYAIPPLAREITRR